MAWGRTLGVEIAPDAPPLREGEDETELKIEYARLVFELGGDYGLAGYSLFQGPENYGRAMQARGWVNDPVVVLELRRLNEQGATIKMLKDRLWAIMNDRSVSVKDQLKAGEQLAELNKWIKQNANVNINNGVVNNNVLRVPAKPRTDEERALYEQRLKTSQMKLVSDARSSK